jgi:vacuolar-type H+-ATPase subunit C/Vma6
MNKTNQTREPLSLDVIMAAISGKEDEMRAVLKHYEGYINALSTKRLFDEEGRQYLFVDDEMRHELEMRLLTKMVTFKPIAA